MKKINFGAFMPERAKLWLLKSYTLAEIVIVMLIIAVVVAVTIGITKAKLDNIVSYTYYNAYSSLRKVSSEILADWDPTDPEYTEQVSEDDEIAMNLNNIQSLLQTNVFNLKYKIFSFYRDLLTQPAYAKCAPWALQPGKTCEESGGKLCDPSIHNENGCYACCTPKTSSSEDSTFTYYGCATLRLTSPLLGSYVVNEDKCYYTERQDDGSVLDVGEIFNTDDFYSCNGQAFDHIPGFSLSGGLRPFNSTLLSSTMLDGRLCEYKAQCNDGYTYTPSNVSGFPFPAGSCQKDLFGGVGACNNVCLSGFTLDSNCNCVCNKTCQSGYHLNSSTCSCEKDSGSACTNKPSKIPCGQTWDESTCSLKGFAKLCLNGYNLDDNCNCVCNKSCPVGYNLNRSNCTCIKKGSYECWDGTYAESLSKCPLKTTCPDGSIAYNLSECSNSFNCWDGSIVHNMADCPLYVTCPDGSKAATLGDCPPDVPEPHPVDNCPLNLSRCKVCDPVTGIISDNPDIERTCADETMEWSEDYCRCVPSARTLPRTGANFCKLFTDYANIKSGTDATACSGSDISSTVTDFSGKNPDIILRNGLLLYNLHSNPSQIALLADNTQGGSYEGVSNTNEWGYTVYVDIDGAKGDSQLWSDVYPFYITLSGKIIPGYDSTHPGEYGGDSTRHLQVSIEYESYTTGKRSLQWLAKSVPFKEGACKAGYVGDATPYCKNNTAITKLSQCSTDGNSLCRLKQIMPIKFFF